MDSPNTSDDRTSGEQIEKNRDGEGLETIGNKIVCILLLKSKIREHEIELNRLFLQFVLFLKDIYKRRRTTIILITIVTQDRRSGKLLTRASVMKRRQKV